MGPRTPYSVPRCEPLVPAPRSLPLQALSLGEFASHRLPSGGLLIFCKPHFKQAFQESGGKYSSLAAEGSMPPASPQAGAAPSASYRPSGLALFDDDHPAPVPKREPPKKDKAAFESGFPQEYQLNLGSAKKMDGNKCTTCSGKVFPFCKLEVGGQLYHHDCFKCAVCQMQLTEKTARTPIRQTHSLLTLTPPQAGWDAEGKPACLKHSKRS